MNDRYDVSVLHRGQSMCDNDGCTSLTSGVQSLLDNLSVINESDVTHALHCYRANLNMNEILPGRDFGLGYCYNCLLYRLIIIEVFF